MSESSQQTAGLIFVLIPAVAYGGASLLRFVRKRTAGYLDNPVRRGLFRAGHAHAGVLLILALVALPYIDAADLPASIERITRLGFTLAPILMPAGFFFSVASPAAERPNRLIYLTYLGGLGLVSSAVTLGAGLLF